MSETCADLSDQDWVDFRFDGHCYFYPARDCPYWEPGTVCGRIGEVIPADNKAICQAEGTNQT